MIQVFMGERGTGKSKKMIQEANIKAKESHGHVVFIDDDSRAMHELERDIRFVNTDAFEIDSFSSLYGLICGILSEDYDVDIIYIDGLLNRIDLNNHCAEKAFNKIENLVDNNKVNLVLAMNSHDEVPEYLKKHIK